MSELERYAPEDIETTWRRAKGYALSGYFADAKSAEQAFVKISAGAEMGLTPFQSMTGIHIIQGKPVVGAGLLAAMVDQHEEYDYTVAWEPDSANATACTVTILKSGQVRGESRFSMDDAKRAGLATANWSKFPSNMLFARAMSNAVRWYAPGVTGTSTYVEGEIPTFEAPPAPEQATAKPRTRVTAEVIPEPVEDAEVIDFDPATEPPPPVVLLPLNTQLRTMSLQDRADLYDLAGIAKGTPLGKVRETLHAVAKSFAELDGEVYDDDAEPNAAQILADARAMQMADLPSDAADTFDHFARTGQDLSDDPQTAIA